ncbi:MAG: hypothetical protein JW882_19920 [Deltaproteobacteria bacterium]|nr:hypothetical protein [Deltaproteobacteria bacterium]
MILVCIQFFLFILTPVRIYFDLSVKGDEILDSLSFEVRQKHDKLSQGYDY